MKKNRIIARLDMKTENVVKGIQFECLRVMGKPHKMVKEYYEQGADEILLIDTVANLYQRDTMINIIDNTTEHVQIPITVGGGIRTVDDIRELLKAGADKVAINTEAVRNPELIKNSAEIFGSQCIVLSVDAKKKDYNRWEAYTNNGREPSGLDVLEWVKKGVNLGAGEVLLTSVDRDGTESGMDIELIRTVSEAVDVPVIASGGSKDSGDIAKAISMGHADAVAVGSILHYQKIGIKEMKEELAQQKISVRILKNCKEVKPKEDDYISNYNMFTLRHLSEKESGLGINLDHLDPAADVGIIDYGINNIKSVAKAFYSMGRKVRIIDSPDKAKGVKCLVLPGVGAFENGMKELNKRGLSGAIINFASAGTPVFGICLGMQLLFETSEEFGHHKGLGLLRGHVRKLDIDSKKYRVPHVGWNEIEKNVKQKNTILSNVPNLSSVYFVHSYCPEASKKDVIASCSYGESKFSVAVQNKNIMATQFHPEKSGMLGLEIIKKYCEICGV